MWLQPFVEIVHADAGVDDGQNDEDEGDGGEEGQGPACEKVCFEMSRLVHADELEQEVRRGREVEKLQVSYVQTETREWNLR